MKSSNFWSDKGYRKRKVDVSDSEEKRQHKIFLTEEILINNLQALSLDIAENKITSTSHNTKTNHECINPNGVDDSTEKQSRFKLHKLLKYNLIRNDLQDSLINRLCDYEQKKVSMQIVPYVPIYSTQLNTNNNIKTVIMNEDEQKKENQNLSAIKTKQNDDDIFKRPYPPTPYKVEEPLENTTRKTVKMKRSYSQSVRYNSNLSVVELKNDSNDYAFHHSQADYFVVEPSTPVTTDSSSSCSKPVSPTSETSIKICEYFDFPSSITTDKNVLKSLDDHVFNIESMTLLDIEDKMEDDI